MLLKAFDCLEDTTATTSTTSTTRTTTETTIPLNCYNPYCKCIVPDVKCEGFSAFNQLSFKYADFNYTFKNVILIPLDKIVLNDNLDVTGLTITTNSNLKLWNIKSFTLSSNPLGKFKFEPGNRYMTVELIDSSFTFDYLQKPLNSICDSSLPENASLSIFFSNMKHINLINSDIQEPICPYIFRNVNFINLKIESLESNSKFAFLNVYNEATINSSNLKYELNSKIENFVVEKSQVGIIDPITNLLNYDVFRLTKKITFTNISIDYIRQDTFFFFPNLTTLKLSPSNWKSFLENGYNQEWMSGLHYLVYADLTNSTTFKNPNRFDFYLGSTKDTYDFPEEDFCRFKEFPHYRRIIPIVNFNYRGECSCTLISILRYAKLYSIHDGNDFQHSIGNTECLSGDYNSTINHCELDDRFSNCTPYTSSPVTTPAQSTLEDVDELTLPLEEIQTTAQPDGNVSSQLYVSFYYYFYLFIFILLNRVP